MKKCLVCKGKNIYPLKGYHPAIFKCMDCNSQQWEGSPRVIFNGTKQNTKES